MDAPLCVLNAELSLVALAAVKMCTLLPTPSQSKKPLSFPRVSNLWKADKRRKTIGLYILDY
jgi:hypothetical protein